MKLEARVCPVCSSNNSELIYKQNFTDILGVDCKLFEQHVVICLDCGMVYVAPFLFDADIEKYYSYMSAYEYSENDYEFGEFHKKRSQQQFNYIAEHVKEYASVLDIGCSTGYTLSLFKDGNVKVLGIDPSQKCSEVAKERYGVEVTVGFLNKNLLNGQTFDVVLLSHVAEHLKYPLQIFSEIQNILNPGGVVFIEVPAIELFDKNDLYQFSFEHINYFSVGSLTNLMKQAGFNEIHHIAFENKMIAPFYPTLGSLWSKSDINTESFSCKKYYEINKEVVLNYVKLIKQYRNELDTKIDGIISRHQNIGIWAAGTLTAQLLAQTNLLKGNITVIFDNDPKKSGMKMSGIEIIKPGAAPEDIVKRVDAIVIGSWSSQDEIYESISYLEGLGIPVYRLFETV